MCTLIPLIIGFKEFPFIVILIPDLTVAVMMAVCFEAGQVNKVRIVLYRWKHSVSRVLSQT